MVHGGIVEGRVLIDDFEGIQAMMDWDEPYSGDVDGRPSAELTLFWTLSPVTGGPLFTWMDIPPDELTPEDAQPIRSVHGIAIHGRFYPTCGQLTAAIALETVELGDPSGPVDVVRTWAVSDQGLSVLERFGIPIELACSNGAGRP
jgi:aminoglycoside phosphotransferase (APT) family kinase protein